MIKNDELEKQIRWHQQLCKVVRSMNSCKFGDEQLNASQVIILHEIQNLKKGSSLASLVARYDISQVLCSKNVGIFYRLGLVTAEENSKDRRKIDLKLTPKGVKVLRQSETHLSKVIRTAKAEVKNTL